MVDRSLDDVRMNLEVLKHCATVLFLVLLPSPIKNLILPFFVINMHQMKNYVFKINLPNLTLYFIVRNHLSQMCYITTWKVPQWLQGEVEEYHWYYIDGLPPTLPGYSKEETIFVDIQTNLPHLTRPYFYRGHELIKA